MRSRTFAAVLAVGVIARCVTPHGDASARFQGGAPACAHVPSGAALLVPAGDGIALVTADGDQRFTLDLGGRQVVRALRAENGAMWVESETDGGHREIHGPSSGGEPALRASGDVHMTGVGVIDGVAVAAIVERHEGAVGSDPYDAVIVDDESGDQRVLTTLVTLDAAIVSATIGLDRIATSDVGEFTEDFTYYRPDGSLDDGWYDPNDHVTGAPLSSAPPLFQWVIAADSGSGDAVLSWVEGPDWSSTEGEYVGGWSVVVADALTGSESLRIDLGHGGKLVHADFDGRFWLGSFSGDGLVDGQPARQQVVVIDTQADRPAAYDTGCPAGSVATLDRSQPAPDVDARTIALRHRTA